LATVNETGSGVKKPPSEPVVGSWGTEATGERDSPGACRLSRRRICAFVFLAPGKFRRAAEGTAARGTDPTISAGVASRHARLPETRGTKVDSDSSARLS
jgi:hypothetical protein